MLSLQNINDAKQKLDRCDTSAFIDVGQSFKFYLNKISITDFRHIRNLEVGFEHPVTVLSGTNRIGKTSILLLIAGSHVNFQKYDSTKPDSVFRNHQWKDVISFTTHETTSNNYSYRLYWRVAAGLKDGEGKRLASSKAWTGLAKYSKDIRRVNAKIRERVVRLIDLERLLPARNFSNSLKRKVNYGQSVRVSEDIEKAFSYVLGVPASVQIFKIGSHINKVDVLCD